MNELSAPITEVASLEPAPPSRAHEILSRLVEPLERFLERQSGQLPLWFVAAVGTGIAMWFALPGPQGWYGLLALAGALFAAGLALRTMRIGRAAMWAGIGLAIGVALVWGRSEQVAAPILERPKVGEVTGLVEKVEVLAARDDIRVTLATDNTTLPPRVRVSMDAEKAPEGLAVGTRFSARARLTPPPPMALPGTHDFARDFWFKGIGAVGRAYGDIKIDRPSTPSGMDSIRKSLDAHIRAQLPSASGSIATALATGDQHAVSKADAEAMRRSGLTHLLSVSGLHIAAVVGAAILLTLKVLALSERLALRFNLVLVAAAFGAIAGISYTWLTGLQVPTVRSCIAALLVLGGIALGRDAISMRLIATGALAVMLIRPEAVPGASFQMSFSAVAAIVAVHSISRVRAFFAPRESPWIFRFGRSILALVVTGLAVELALVPLALYHFHKSGLYGVMANLLAIPWTTFVVMPLEAIALLLDPIGLSAPFWAATGWSIDMLLGLAHFVGDSEGAVASIPAMPRPAFALMIFAGLWLCLWEGKVRLWGFVPGVVGAVWAAMTPVPDLMVTGDGRHMVIVDESGKPVMLRERSGDYMKSLMSEASGFDGEPVGISTQHFANCSNASCIAAIDRDGKRWLLMATRSRDFMRWDETVAACGRMDFVVSDRRLPKDCNPRILKLDPTTLAESGGVSIYLGKKPRIETVMGRTFGHPWVSFHQ